MHNDTDDKELTDVELATEAYNVADTNLRKAKRLADQRENLLPRLEAKLAQVRQKLCPLEIARDVLDAAIDSIQDGTPTDLKLRKPRKPRSAEGA